MDCDNIKKTRGVACFCFYPDKTNTKYEIVEPNFATTTTKASFAS